MRQAKPDLRSKFPDQEGLQGVGQSPTVLKTVKKYTFMCFIGIKNALDLIKFIMQNIGIIITKVVR